MRSAVSSLRFDRVRGDVEVLSRAGLELEDFLEEAVESVQRAVPWTAACIGTHDPSTRILTSARKYGDLAGNNDGDALFGVIEYDSPEETSYRNLIANRVSSLGMHALHHGEVERSERMSRLMIPEFGYRDEARTVFHDSDRMWGGMALFRGSDERPFSEDEIDFLATLSRSFVLGVRGGILSRLGQVAGPAIHGPAVLVVNARDEVVQMTPAAQSWLAQLSPVEHSADPASLITPLVATARRQARAAESGAPSSRVRTASGVWLVLHASSMSGAGAAAGDVVVTFEEARPPEVIALIVAAFGLTAREEAVVQLVIQGLDTRDIATALHLSPYTVQDHLKGIFEKAGVRSRRELVARVYFDQYLPRLGDQVSASGAFATV